MQLQNFFLLALLVPALANAEIYKNINPLDTLADVKSKFPNAIYEKVPAAWVTEMDSFYKITGQGLSGRIMIKFNDYRPVYKKMADDNPNSESFESMQNLANQSDEDALSVDWVRWIPEPPIPLERFMLKYGKPDKSGFDDDNMDPYKSWESRGIMVYLTNDGKDVYKVDFSFTNNEMRKAWKSKYNYIPKELEIPIQKNKK
jgi:hypothetical protein